MSRYIDADLLLAQCRRNPLFEKTEKDKGMIYIERSIIDDTPTADVVEIPEGGIGNLSDGYHTFNELYHHRAILFSVICNSMPDKAWKSKLHDTGDMYDGMFIVGIETPEGQATYHYDIDPYWDMFKVKELEKAPKWDGHTPQVAIDRISKISADVVEVVRCKDCKHYGGVVYGGVCRKYSGCETKVCTEKDHYCSYGERKDEAIRNTIEEWNGKRDKSCDTCAFYNEDRDNQPCCYCAENSCWVKGEEDGT